MKTRAGQITLHILGCAVFLSLPIFFSPDFLNPDRPLFTIRPFQRDFFGYVLLILFFYLNHYLFIPKFYFRKKYIAFGLLLLSAFIVILFLPGLIFSGRGDFSHPHGNFGPSRKFFFLMGAERHLFRFLIVAALSLMIRISGRLKLAEQERINAELSYLKAQINPHFLFNTLNSIYSLAIDKSDETAEAVVKLSGMMRYVITEANNKFVPLEKEISYISDYISLQKLRLDQNVKLTYTVTGEPAGKEIAPIILISFIENAFKYGVSTEEESFIGIKIDITGDHLHLFINNKKVVVNDKPEGKSGLGIENTKYRLQLLYPAAHKLIISETKENFSVTLSIFLR